MKGANNMLSRKHYKMIAKCIKDNTMQDTQPIINKVRFIEDISNELKRDNINFNYTTFKDACQ